MTSASLHCRNCDSFRSAHLPRVHQPLCWLCAALIALASGCSERSADTETNELLLPPPRFEQLEPGVRQQFTDLSSRIAHVRDTSRGPSDTETGESWGQLGQWFQVYRYPDSAVRCYREAMRLDSQDPRWPYYLGMVAVEAGRLEEAASAFEAAMKRAPDSTAALIRLADLTLTLRQPEKAMEYFNRALALEPGNPAAAVGRARLHLQRQEPDEALHLLRPLLTSDARALGHIHYLMAQANRLQGNRERARYHLDQVPESDEDPSLLVADDPWLDELMTMNISSNQLTRLGMRAYRRGSFRMAAVHAGRAARLNPDNPELRTNYAAALLALGRHRDAMEQSRLALEQNPNLPRAYLIKAGSHRRAGQAIEARDALLQALALDPDMKDARQQLGRVYQTLGQTELAITQYAELRRRFGESRQVRFWHAALLAAIGRHEESLAALHEDLATHPRSRLLQLLRIRMLSAAAHDSTRDPERAFEMLRAVEAEAADVFHAESAAMVAAAMGRHELAVEWQLRALRALESMPRSKAARIARRRLTLYEEGQTCRTPWEEQEALITKPVDGPGGANQST